MKMNEKVYTDMEEWNEIRHRVLVEGQSKRTICKEFGLHWQTLDKILSHSSPPGYRMRERRKKRKLEAFLPIIEEILREDRTMPPKQRHTARRVQLAGCTRSPNETWMKQIARNLTDPLAGLLSNYNYLLVDRDSNYSKLFRHVLKQVDVHGVQPPTPSPNRTPHIERFMRTIKDECLHRMPWSKTGSAQLHLLARHYTSRHKGYNHRQQKTPGRTE